MEKTVKIFAPATVSNVGPGFDIAGFALEKPGDILVLKLNNNKTLRIINSSGTNIPENPEKNVAGVAVKALLDKLKSSQGFDLIFERKISPGSGIGSSAASCTAAVYGANILLETPYNPKELITFALKGEMLASGSLHADNIAPAMLGGFVFIKSYKPMEIIQIKPPEKLLCALVHPSIQINTCESRKILPEKIPMKSAIKQCGNLAGLIAGITLDDYNLIYRSLHDQFAEPFRKRFIPGYDQLKSELTEKLTGGCNISGSGPSVFFLSHIREDIIKAVEIMKNIYNNLNIEHEIYISEICAKGTRILE